MVKLAPLVTGISPKEGPPGTRVTLRGENLGNDSRDLIGLTICGVDCLLSAVWKSQKQIIVRTGQAKGKGDIVVTTRSGGQGTSTVQFRGFQIQIGPLQESAIWVDETQLYSAMENRGKSNPVELEYLDDPLGICDESNDKKPSEEELQDLLQEGSGNTNLENFDPAWFLLENHQKTSFEDLKSGLAHLKHRSVQHEEGPFAFAKTNLTTFLDCFDTLTELNGRLAKDEREKSGASFTSKLEDILIKSNRAAEDVFQVVLGRKDRADSTRNALGVINRFKLLFFLPSTIDKNIEKGDYDLVITDYTRAKSLSWLTEIPVFSKVFAEIESKMAEFRKMLYERLMTLPTTIDEQKKYIRYITHLEADGDPAWECIVNYQKWIIQLMHTCKRDHVTKELEEETQKNSLKALIASASSSSSSSPSLTSSSSSQMEGKGDGINKGSYPSRVMFVDFLTKIVCDNFPNLWKLGQSYVNGKLMKEVKRDGKADLEKQNKFVVMMQDIIGLYLSLIRCAFLPQTVDQSKMGEEFSGWTKKKNDSFKSWLPVCVKHVRYCITSLTSLDLPLNSLELLQATDWLLRSNAVDNVLKKAIADVKELKVREIWTLETDDKLGSTTVLPALFEGLVNEMVHTLQDVVSNRPGEKQLFLSDAKSASQTKDSCIKLLQDFSSTLLSLASLEDHPSKTPVPANRRSTKFGGKSKNVDPTPAIDKRLIIIMNNCSLMTKMIIPRLIDVMNKHGYPVDSNCLPAVTKVYKELDQQLFTNYVEVKSNPIIGSLEQNMHSGKFTWNNCPPPQGVRNYIKESILGILEVHAEVYSIGPAFLDRVLCNIIESTAEELSRLFQCASEFNDDGALQARLDLEAFEASVGIYKTQKSSNFVKEAMKCVPELSPEQRRAKDQLLMAFKSEMRFYLLCFEAS